MSWLVLLVPVLVLGACSSWIAWDNHVRYGPIIRGNARWRREAPLRAARAAEREILAALTPDDRVWLREMGWRDPLARWAAPTTAELIAGVRP